MKYNSTTTLNEIRAKSPCEDGWKKLLTHLGKTEADDEPLELLTVLNSNGLDDAIWCLRAESLERLSRHFQAWCAEQVLHVFETARPNDLRVRQQIEMLRNDNASPEQRDDTLAAALDAAWDTTLEAAARDAACTAVRDTARDAALDAALAAARGAAGDTTEGTALNAAALAAALDNALDNALDDDWAASWETAWAAARAAAREAVGDEQEKQLRKMIEEN